jgi:hypothetical protein
MVSIEQAHETMLELYTGELEPSMRQALFNASLSKRVPLVCNSAYAIALRPYRELDLPDPEYLNALLKRANRHTGAIAYGLMESHLTTLYHVARAWDDGSIDLDYGNTLTSQRDWRHRVARIWGVGYKVASWALCIYDPAGCLLMPIDTVHCDRLGIPQNLLRKTGSGFRLYEEMEDYMREECEVYPEYPCTSVSAMHWFNHRNVGATPHAGLSCRIGA